MLGVVSGCSFRPLLTDVSVQPDVISPNADGDTDATNIRYTLGRSANVSICFENEQDERFYFVTASYARRATTAWPGAAASTSR